MKIDSFWGDNRFLSNFHPSPVEMNGLTFPTVEHAYQAAKTTVREFQEAIQECDTPGKAKRMGRAITIRKNWDVIKNDVMLALLRQKFGCSLELTFKLLATGDAHLEEGNDHGDMYWGTVHGFGQNHLGKMLMKVRSELRAEMEDE